MKRTLLRGAYLCGALVVLWLCTGMVARFRVTRASAESVLSSLSQTLGVPVSARDAGLDIASWLRLGPAIRFDDVAAGNLLRGRHVSVGVALIALLEGRVEIRAIRIEGARISDLEALLKRLGAPGKPALGIEEVRISDGEALLPGGSRIRGVSLRVRDLNAVGARIEMRAAPIDDRVSEIRFEGRAGPFMPRVLPLYGELTVVLAPGERARAVLEASVRGDLYRGIAGIGRVKLSGFSIGRDRGHGLSLEGQSRALVSAQGLLSTPTLHVQVLNAKLTLGGGEWAGAADLRMSAGTISGASRGSLRNADGGVLMGGLAQGALEIPNYEVQFSGRTADELRRSLTGTATVTMANGSIAALDGLRPGRRPSGSLRCDLRMSEGRLDVTSLAFDSPGLMLTGTGSIGADESLRFTLSERVNTGGPAVPVTIDGTIAQPLARHGNGM